MKIVHSGDPGVLNLRSDVVGCVIVAGLILMAGGVLSVAFALGRIPVEASLEPELKNIVLAGGTLITLLGLVFFGGRSGKIIDGRSRSLMTWRGLVVPMSRKNLPLNGYSWIVLTKEIHRSKNSSTTLYPVRLEGDSEPALTIDTASDVLEARRLSEAIAKVLRLPMTDSTSGQTVIRDPDLLDESLRSRMDRLGETIEVPPRPTTMRSHIEVDGSSVRIEIPGLSAKTRLIINLVVTAVVLGPGLVFSGAVVFGDDGASMTEKIPLLIFGGFFLIPLLVILGKIRKFKRPVTVTANRVALTIIDGRKITEIPGDELEELWISGRDINQVLKTQPDGSLIIDGARVEGSDPTTGPPPKIPPALAGVVRTMSTFAPENLSILARSDNASINFGSGLDSEEITYLYSVIMKAMVG